MNNNVVKSKSREYQVMLMAAIQKQYTTVSFIQSKLKIQFKFPYMEFPYISFSKEKEFNNACDDHYGDV